MSLRSFAETAAHSLGAVHAVRYKNRRRARILMYHRFHGSPEQVRARLTAQCARLSRDYRSVSLSEVAAALREGRDLPPNSLAITVDDGYRDFALAFPIFRSFGLKVTLYVVTEFAEGAIWLWPDQVQYLIENTSLTEATVGPLPLPLTDRPHAIQELDRLLIGMRNSERLRTLRALPAILETPLPAAPPIQFAPLSWDELRVLAADGLDVGAHTRTHPIVSMLESAVDRDEEIGGAKRRIEEKLGAPVRSFCYPNGKFPDYDAECIAAVKQAGYETAVIAEAALVQASSDVYQLPRVGIEPDYPALYFDRCVAGFRLS
jgi:peptidoglycan/xylan/chitin deacetylase (PgdA/CDA1 family)